MQANMARLAGLSVTSEPPPAIDVNVVSHPMQRYAVWFGGSMLAATVRQSDISDSNLPISFYSLF